MNQTPNPMTINKAQAPGIVMLVCAALLAVGLFTPGWGGLSKNGGELNVGMFGAEGCRRGECRSADWEQTTKMLKLPGDASVFRTLGLVTGILALIATIIVGVMAIANKTSSIPLLAVQPILGAAAFCLTYFAIRLSSTGRADLNPGYSAFLAIGGLLAVGVIMQTWMRPLIAEAKPSTAYAAAPPGYGHSVG